VSWRRERSLAMTCNCWVNSSVCRDGRQLLVLFVLSLHCFPFGPRALALGFARFCEIITNVLRKIASSETIIVRRPYG
jgi:hypothetical protein